MTRIAIVGTGFGGLGAAVRLLQQGQDDLVLYERSTEVGGVWRDNTYPGAACDVPSHLYSFSFAPSGTWSRRFAPQEEIHGYLRKVAEDFGVRRHIRFSTEVLKATWSEPVWQLELSDGTTDEVDVLLTACGQLSRPARPDIPGLDTFAGPSFHSADWDHALDLSGRRVAVLGTGASAIQFVPEIAKQAAHLTVFQRSAPYVIHKPDRVYGPVTHAVLDRAPWVLTLDRLRTFCTNEARSLGFNTEPRLMKGFELKFSRHLRKQVTDPELRQALTPDYPIGCKRILQSNEWYPALAAPHVDVVTDKVSEVRPDAVVTTDGREHEADVLILGTGFAATELIAPMEVVGRDGVRLADVWEHGAEAYLGTAVSGFPNLFLMYGPNTNLGHNSIILMLESQIALITSAVGQLAQHRTIEVREQVQRRFNSWLQKRLSHTVFAGGCTSWYVTAEGKNTQNWPGTTLDFRRRTRRFDPADWELDRQSAGVPA